MRFAGYTDYTYFNNMRVTYAIQGYNYNHFIRNGNLDSNTLVYRIYNNLIDSSAHDQSVNTLVTFHPS